MKHRNVWIDTFKGLPSAQQKTAAKTQHFAAAENTFMPVYYDRQILLSIPLSITGYMQQHILLRPASGSGIKRRTISVFRIH